MDKKCKNINKHITFNFLSEQYKIEKCNFKRHYMTEKDSTHSLKKHFHNFYEMHLI